jgi:hypothetical protein
MKPLPKALNLVTFNPFQEPVGGDAQVKEHPTLDRRPSNPLPLLRSQVLEDYFTFAASGNTATVFSFDEVDP